MKNGFFFILMLGLLGFTAQAYSQTQAHYVTAATFYISVDDWADISLNGIPIIDSVPRTGADKSLQKIEALPESLCLFKENNVLAIEVDDSTRPADSRSNYVGIAYVLRLDFSDGTQRILSSNEADQHRAYYVPSHELGNPTGWQRFNFNDGYWGLAKATGSSIPDLSALDSPELNGVFQFLSAASFSPRAQSVGEKHLFRRKFSLDISPNPNCDKPTKSPRIEPMIVTQPDQRHPVKIPTPVPTSTATPLPFMAFTPSWTPTPVIYQTPIVKVKTFRKARLIPTPTPPIVFIKPTEPTPAEEAVPVTVAQVVPPTPTPVFTVIPSTSEGQTIVFDVPPANIYMSFAEGPGVYRLEILDKYGRHLRNLFEMKVVAQADAWAEWDGKNDEGQDALPGLYYVVYSKAGKVLRKMTLLRTGQNK